MRTSTALATLLVVAALIPTTAMQSHQGFLGRWNMTGTGKDANRVYWLEVSEKGGQLSGMFLNRSSSPLQLASVKVENGLLVFQLPVGTNKQPGAEFRAKLEGDKLVGTTTAEDRTINWVGVRPPKWPAANANATHKYGTPVELVGPKVQTLDAFHAQSGDKILNWAFEEGVLTNTPKSSNLVSNQKFKDFRVQAEYKLGKDSNSGLYLRGRYELQILDDFGKEPDKHSHMAIYGWTPPLKNASKPIGEWQTMEAVLVANRVTVTLNGQKVHDNAEIQAVTGGVLDADEAAAGPFMIQGDHAKVWMRRLVVTPIQ
jgi:hypothetical protein